MRAVPWAVAVLASSPCCVPAAQQPAAEVEVGASYEHLTKDRAPWRSVHAQAAWNGSAGQQLNAGVRRTSRFELEDTEISLGGGAPLPWGWSFTANVAGSPTHEILPRWLAQAALQHALAAGVNGSLQWRRSLYGPQAGTATRGSTALGVGLEWYAGNWRLAWNGSRNRLDSGGHAFSQWAQFDRYYGEQASGQVSRIGLLMAAGRELDNIPGAGLVVTSVRGIGLLGLHRVDSGWSVSWELSSTRQGDAYRRTGLRLGLRRSI